MKVNVDQQLMVEVLLETKNRLLEVQRMIKKAETKSERAALLKAADELKQVIRRNLG